MPPAWSNPGRHPAFTSRIYPHEGDYTMKVPSPVPGIPDAEIPASRDPIATHNLIATDHPLNEPLLAKVLERRQRGPALGYR
jgi:hypothetical protein